MRIGFDISPLKSGHRVRGIGNYTKNLFEQFQKKQFGPKFEFFDNPASPPPVDLIHHPYFDLFFHTLPIRKKISRVVTIHDVIPLVFPEHFPRGIRGNISFFLQKLAVKNTSAVICDSQNSKKDVVSKLSFPEKKIYVIHLAPASNFKPLDDNKFLLSVAKKYKLPEKFGLYVGDVNWNKNILNLLKAVKVSKVNLVMVGQALIDNNLYQKKDIDQYIKENNLAPKIIRTGYVPQEDLVAICNLAFVTLLPSYYEGFGLPILESMACGTPVVCSNVASLPEIAGDLAFYCNPDDSHDIAKQITSIINLSIQKRESISKQIISHARNFTWQKTARETIKVYKTILDFD